MKISGYTWAANAKGKLLPYEACVKSMLPLVDEVWVVYDPRYDLAETFTGIDSKVGVISFPFLIESITGNGNQLSQSRRQCTGDWFLWLDLDELIHEKDIDIIKNLIAYADSNDYNAIELSVYSPFMKCYTFGNSDLVQWGIRPKLLKNVPGVIHGIPSDATKEGSDGKLRLAYGDGIDFVKDGVLFPHRALTFRDYPFLGKLATGSATCDDVLKTTESFPYIYHYARYSMQRKLKMKTWQRDHYFQGHSDDYEPDIWAANLAKNVELEQGEEVPGDNMLGPVIPSHPTAILPWLEFIDNAITIRETQDG